MIILHVNYNGYYFTKAGNFYLFCESATDNIIMLSNSLDFKCKYGLE